MDQFTKNIIFTNERWIAMEVLEISNLKDMIAEKENAILKMQEQNRILKERE